MNLVALYQHMGKPKEVVNRYLKYHHPFPLFPLFERECSPWCSLSSSITLHSQAKARTPKHPYIKELELLEQSWERLVSRFSPTQAS